MQSESYKSTISHELRTPLNSSSFITQNIIDTLSTADVISLASIKDIKQMASLILAQLQFMECFIEDLLNLNMSREGI